MEFLMYRYAFLFKFEDIEMLKLDLVNYSNKDKGDKVKYYILSQQMQIKKLENIIYFNRLNTVEIRIYEKYYIFIVFTNKIRDIMKYNFLINYSKINLVDNRFVEEVFRLGFSNNLTSISLETDKNYGEETLNLVGNKLFNIDIFEDMNIFEDNSIWNISEYSFQPILMKYCIKIKAPNIVEFNKKMLKTSREKIIDIIISIVMRDGCYGRKLY